MDFFQVILRIMVVILFIDIQVILVMAAHGEYESWRESKRRKK